jgi:hypothetical protein
MGSTTSQSSARQKSSLADRLARRGFYSDKPLLIALSYLALLTLAEVLTVLVAAQAGVLLHLCILFLLLLHTASTWERPLHRMLMALAFVPLIRVISMSLPLAGFPLLYWYLITSVPLSVAAVVVMRLLGMGRRDLGLHWRAWPVQLVVGLSGMALGYVEYLILHPEPLVDEFSLAQIWLPALILLVSTGYLEELIFRRLMQRTAVEHLGRWLGVLYVAIFFAMLHIGYQSLADVLFVLVVALAFGLVVHFTDSLIGVTLAHGLTNISLFLVVPFFITAPETPRLPIVQASPPTAAISQAVATSTMVASVSFSPTPPESGDLPTAVMVTVVNAPAAALPVTAAVQTAVQTAVPATVQSTAPAAASTAAPAGVTFAQHVVQPGQSLSFLARYYQTTVEAIREQNNLPDSALPEEGLLLWIPVERASPLVPTGRSHIIQAGETLFRIARQYDTTVAALVALNWLPSRSLIYPGQVLWLPETV